MKRGGAAPSGRGPAYMKSGLRRFSFALCDSPAHPCGWEGNRRCFRFGLTLRASARMGASLL